MIIDYVASLGCFAFRNVPDSGASELLALMDREGIDTALVSALEGVMYRNVQAANELLVERLKGHEERLIGAAVVNPAYPRAAEDARECLTTMGMRAIRLYPGYHGYALGDLIGSRSLCAVMSVAEELRVPVSIAFIVEDPRQRHVLVNPPPVKPEDAARMIRMFPNVNFVLERLKLREIQEVHASSRGAANWFVETSGRFLTVTPADALE